MLAMIIKEFRQVVRDKRTLAMLIVMPVVLLLVFGYAASFDVEEIPTVVVGLRAGDTVDLLPDLFEVVAADDSATAQDAVDYLVAGDAQVAVLAEPGGPTILIDGSQLFTAQAALQAVAVAQTQIPGLEYEILFNPDLDTSTVLVPGLAGLIIVFVGTLITSMSVVRERESGTFEQLAVMPFRPRDVFVGKIAPYFLVALVDLVIVLLIGIFVFGVPFNGSVLPLAYAALMFIFVALGLGILISSVSQNQGQAIQLALMTVMPQIILSGIIFPLSSMAPGVRWIGYLLPLTYFNEVAVGVMVRGAPAADLVPQLIILSGMAVLIFGLAVLRFARQLRPARAKVAS